MSSNTGWREAIKVYIRREAQPPEKYSHQPRLYALTRQLAAAYPEVDDDILFAAAWLHDVGVFVGHRPDDRDALACWDNVAYAAELAPTLLIQFGFPAGKIELVVDCIRQHQPQANPMSMEATILRDADILEQLGAVGILRTVAKIGRDTRFHGFAEALDSLTRALNSLPDLLRLPASRQLAEERCEIHDAFLAAAALEMQYGRETDEERTAGPAPGRVLNEMEIDREPPLL